VYGATVDISFEFALQTIGVGFSGELAIHVVFLWCGDLYYDTALSTIETMR